MDRYSSALFFCTLECIEPPRDHIFLYTESFDFALFRESGIRSSPRRRQSACTIGQLPAQPAGAARSLSRLLPRCPTRCGKVARICPSRARRARKARRASVGPRCCGMAARICPSRARRPRKPRFAAVGRRQRAQRTVRLRQAGEALVLTATESSPFLPLPALWTCIRQSWPTSLATWCASALRTARPAHYASPYSARN